MSDRGPDEVLAGVVQSARNIKFGRGVVSKTSYVAALVVAAWGVIVFRLGDNLITNGALLLAGLVATGFAFWYIRSSQKFAEQNPSLALLEGAELIEWQKLEVAAKGGLLQQPDDKMLEIKPASESDIG